MSFLIMAVRLFAAGALAFGLGAAHAQEIKPIKMKMAHFLPATFSGASIDQWFADEVRRRTNGAVDIEIFWAGSMGSAAELASLVGAGAMDLAAFPLGYYPQQFPLSSVGSMPRVFQDVSRAHQAMSSIFELPEVQAEHKKNNVVMLMSHHANPYRLACNKGVGSLNEMQGYRVRSMGADFPPIYRALGFVPVNTPSNEVYESLDKGNINCAVLSYDQMWAAKIYEVARHANDINFGALATWQIWMNDRKFNALPGNVRQVLKEVGRDAMERDAKEAAAALDQSLVQLKQAGVQFALLADMQRFVQLVPSSIDGWYEKMRRASLEKPADKILAVVRPEAERVH